MDGARFDALARAVANGTASRRSVLRGAVAALAGVFAGRSRASEAGPAALPASGHAAKPRRCPSSPCLTCDLSDLATFKGCEPCADRCLAGDLATAAGQDPTFQTLAAELKSRGFRSTKERLTLTVPGIADGYVALYREKGKEHRTAQLVYTPNGVQQTAMAFILRGKTVVSALGVDEQGKVIEQAPPAVSAGAAGGLRAMIPAQADRVECAKCYDLCDEINSPVANAVICGVAGFGACVAFLGPAALACGIVAGAACNELGAKCSRLLCEGHEHCPRQCDPACENTDPETGACISLCQKPNTVCTNRACVCVDVTCGDACCAPGEVCRDGACAPNCGPCGFPDNAGQCFNTCSHGNGVPADVCCVGSLNANGTCCGRSQTCCDGACCDGACDSSGSGCCTNVSCNGACCGADQSCCGETCCDGPCDASGSACCTDDRICGGTCCSDNKLFCCNGQCCEHRCAADGTCCPDGRLCDDGSCCPAGQACTLNDGCCPLDRACHSDYCCSPGQICCAHGCCDGPCDGSSGDCCPPDRVCGEQCCPPDHAFCCDGECCEHHCDNTGLCCPGDRLCADDTCCPEGFTCHTKDGSCCPVDRVCDDGTCCPAGNVCCADGCCEGVCQDNGACCPTARVCPGQCCPDGQECCPDGTCQAVGACCPEDQRCGETCCADGQTCCGETCCDGPCDATGSACCPGASICGGVCCGADRQCCNGACIAAGDDCTCPPERDCSDYGLGCCDPGLYCATDYDGNGVCCSQPPCDGSCCAAGDTCLSSQYGSQCCGAGMVTGDGLCCGFTGSGNVPCGNECCFAGQNEVCTADGCCNSTQAVGGRCCRYLVCGGACCGPTDICGSFNGEAEHCIPATPI